MDKCNKCSNGTTRQAKYICRENDYSLVELNGDLIKKLSDHDIPSGDVEIGSYNNITYCSCDKFWS